MKQSILEKEYYKKILESISKEFEQECFCSIGKMVKRGNIQVTYLQVTKKNSDVSQRIYLNYFFEKHMSSDIVTDKIKKIIAIFLEQELKKIKKVTCKNNIYEQMFCCYLTNYKNNQNYLKENDIVYKTLFDNELVLVARVYNEELAFDVTNQLLKELDINKDTFFQKAMNNIEKNIKYEIVENLLNIKLPKSEIEPFPILVLSNIENNFGAVNMLQLNQLAYISELEFDGHDVIIVPSSIHEVLLLKNDIIDDFEGLRNLVRTVNSSSVAVSELLSNNLFLFKARTKTIKML